MLLDIVLFIAILCLFAFVKFQNNDKEAGEHFVDIDSHLSNIDTDLELINSSMLKTYQEYLIDLVDTDVLIDNLSYSNIGYCEVDRNQIITYITGGALAAVGENYRNWLGTALQPPYSTEAWPTIKQGEKWLGLAEVNGHQVCVVYQPKYDSGEFDGAIVWWLLVPNGFELSLGTKA